MSIYKIIIGTDSKNIKVEDKGNGAIEEGEHHGHGGKEKGFWKSETFIDLETSKELEMLCHYFVTGLHEY